MHRKALKHLQSVDPVLERIIEQVGPCRLRPAAELSHYESVARSIVFQQLSGKAAETIYGRFAALFAGRPTATAMMALQDDAIRATGISRQKLSYLRDLSERVAGGSLPLESIADCDDQAVIGHLTAVKGVGLWTAQMFLLFRLGRPDILPEGDLGVQKAMQRAYRMRKLPTPKRVLTVGAKWAPYRSVATWYLWRSLEV